MTEIFWTEQKVDDLKLLWSGDDSASEIAAQLGTTRNAVLGKVHRLKLPTRIDPNFVPKSAHRSFFRAERMPPKEPAPLPAPKIITAVSPITGQFISQHRRPNMEREPTKQELRDMLREAVVRTAGMQG